MHQDRPRTDRFRWGPMASASGASPRVRPPRDLPSPPHARPAAAPQRPPSSSARARRSIWTDGACSGNPGPGGWAAIVVPADGGDPLELSGGEPATTNNRMELHRGAGGPALAARRRARVRGDRLAADAQLDDGLAAAAGSARAGRRPPASRSRTRTCSRRWRPRSAATAACAGTGCARMRRAPPTRTRRSTTARTSSRSPRPHLALSGALRAGARRGPRRAPAPTQRPRASDGSSRIAARDQRDRDAVLRPRDDLDLVARAQLALVDDAQVGAGPAGLGEAP